MRNQRVAVPCPSCRRDLRIRIEHLGRKGACHHCGHRFRALVEGPGRRSGSVSSRLGGLESEFSSRGAPPATSFDQERVGVQSRRSHVAGNRSAQIQEGLSASSPPDREDDGLSEDGVFVEFNPELDELEQQYEEERDALALELQTLRRKLREAESARDAARAEHALIRAAWDRERRGLEAERNAWKGQVETLRAQVGLASSSLCFARLSHPDA